MSCTEHHTLTRRDIIRGAAATSLALWTGMPRTASAAAARDPRMLTIILRGGLDGLALAAPVGDPSYQQLRGRIALQAAGAAQNAGLPLDELFVLNPGMPTLHRLYREKEALILHAVATGYRGRSHFDGQDVLESGLPGIGRSDDGWLNRALLHLPQADAARTKGLSMGAVVPLIMRGSAPVVSWIPKVNDLELRSATVERLLDLYRQTDPALAKAFTEGLGIGAMTAGAAHGSAPIVASGQATRPFRDFVETAETAARFLGSPDGPRVGVLSYNGWDTHANEGASQGQLTNRLAALDTAIDVFVQTIGPAAWRDTVVVITTEFGRTARANGTDGTDHGTGMAAILVGGAVDGGRIITDWPGLSEKALFEGRDLAPTADLRAALKGVLADHLGVSPGRLATLVFPNSAAIAPLPGLIRSR